MKNFIQDKLRGIFEVESMTTINRPSEPEKIPQTNVDLPTSNSVRDTNLSIPNSLRFSNSQYGLTTDDIESMINDAKQLANYIKREASQIDPNVPNDMLLSHEYGVEGSGYEYKIFKRPDGKFSLIGKPTTKHFAPGEYNLYGGTAGKILYMYTMGCSKYPASGAEGNCKVIYNPMADAKIKLLSDPDISDAILSFIGKEVGYLDDKGLEIQGNKNTPDEIARAEKKLQRQTTKASPLGLSADLADVKAKIDDIVSAKLKARSERDFEVVKKLNKIEHQLRAQFERLKKK